MKSIKPHLWKIIIFLILSGSALTGFSIHLNAKNEIEELCLDYYKELLLENKALKYEIRFLKGYIIEYTENHFELEN